MTESRRPAWRILGLVIMVASVLAVAWTITADEDGWAAFRSIGFGAVVALVALQAAGLLTQAYRYRLAIDEAGTHSVPPFVWLRLFILGRFLNALVPQAGNAYRSLRLKDEYGLPISRYLGAFLAFIWLSTLINLAATLVVLLIVEPDLDFGGFSAPVFTVLLFGLAAGAPGSLLWLLRRIRTDPSSRTGWAHRRTQEMLDATIALTRSRATLLRFAAAALIGLGLWVTTFAVAFEAVGVEISLSAVTLFYVLQQLGTYWNITPGNLGVQELYSGLLAAQLGVGLTAGLVVAALIRLTALLTLLIFGVGLGGVRVLRQVRRDGMVQS